MITLTTHSQSDVISPKEIFSSELAVILTESSLVIYRVLRKVKPDVYLSLTDLARPGSPPLAFDSS